MTISYNDSSTWRTLSEVYYNDGGVWRTLSEVHYNDGGVWRQVFAAVLYTGSHQSTDSFFIYMMVGPIVDINGATWTIETDAGSFNTYVKVNQNVAVNYWDTATWGTNQVNRSSASAFVAWDGSVTTWRFGGDTFGLNETGVSKTLTID